MPDETPPAGRSVLDVSTWLEGIKQMNGTRILAVLLGVFLWFTRADIRDLVVRLDAIVTDERVEGRKAVADLGKKIDRSIDAQESTAKSVQKLVDQFTRRSTAEPPLIVIP